MHCEAGDNCHYCHTRTEQQFHPEIYKSTKCNDVQQTNFCPRGPFCAFAHNDQEMNAERELSMESASDLANIINNAFASGALNTNAALDKSSTLNASTNSNNSTNGISNLVNQFNSNQQLNQFHQSSSGININNQQQQQTNNGTGFMPSSVPSHFGFSELAASGLRSQPSGLGAFRRENSPPMLGSHNNSNNLGPIARPRSYSSSHTSNLHHNLNSITREQILNTYFKNSIEEKTAVNGLNQQNILPMRKVSTPSTLFAANSNAQQQFNALQSNLVNTNSNNHLASSIHSSSAANQYFQNLDSTNTTVESVVHSLALDDLTLDDLEESIEKDLLNHGLAASSSMQDDQRNNLQQNASSVNLVRSSSNLINANNNGGGTAPVNIPGANQRTDIANINSPLVGFGQSPLSTTSLNHNVSSSVGSSLYDFASHSNMSPTNQQQQLNLIQQQQQHNQQAILMNEIHRLRDELVMTKNKGIKYEEELQLVSIGEW